MLRSFMPLHRLSPPRVGAFVGSLALVLVAGAAGSQEGSPCTGEPVTCNDDRTVCCNWWVADVTVDGQKTGAVLEDSYEKLVKSAESHRKTDAMLCAYWHDHGDCAAVVGPPHCSGAVAGAVKQLATSAPVPITKSIAAGEAKLVKLAKTFDDLEAFTSEIRAAGGAQQAHQSISAIRSSIKAGKSTGEAAAGELLSRIRGAVMGSHKALDEYTKNLAGALSRAKGLRTQLTQCARTHNPFLELDPAGDGGDLPRVWRTTMNFGYGFAPTFEFDTPGGQKAQAVAGEEGRRSLAEVVARAPQMPPIETLHLDGKTTVSAQKTSGAGRLLFGGKGFLDAKATLGAGDYPLLFAADGPSGIAFSAVSITRAPRAGGERVTIRGSAGGGEETVELLVCSGGRETQKGQCACPKGQEWTGASCACPQGQHLEGGVCRSCPKGQEWTGASCGCPQGQHLDRGKCQSCPTTMAWNGQRCDCPADAHWIGGACRACGGGSTWDGQGCACPPGQHVERGACASCPQGTTWNGSACICPQGTTWNGQSCAAPNSGALSVVGQCSQFALGDDYYQQRVARCLERGGACVAVDISNPASLPHDPQGVLARMLGKRMCSWVKDVDNKTKSLQCCIP